MSATRNEPENCNRQRLIEAAVRTIQANGISRAFIDDIAREAGLSRPTAYRMFGSRRALLESVAAHSANLFKDVLRIKLKSYKTFADVLVLGTVESLRIARDDAVFMALLEALADQGFERYMLDPSGPIFAYTLEAWKESFAEARASGTLRKGITDQELVTLICGAQFLFLLRDDFDRKRQISFLRKFMLPAVLDAGE